MTDYCNEYVDWAEVDVPDAARKSWQAALGYVIGSNPGLLWEQDRTDWRRVMMGRHCAYYDLFNGNSITSPIEQQLAGWLAWLDGGWHGYPQMASQPRTDHDYKFDRDELFFGVDAQAHVGRYRLDFMIVVNGCDGTKRLGIECDGHAFHEKTKEQAAKDKKRDRDLLLAGIPLMRFTGSEIFRAPEACFEQIQEAVDAMVSDCGPWANAVAA